MSLNEICFFNNIDTIKTSEVISVENSEYLQLDVTGTASNFKIIVYAQAVKEGQFLPLVVIGNGNFKIYDSIESNGFYRVSTRGVLNVKLVLLQIESGNLNCFGSLSLRRDVSDWNSSKETDLGYIKNRPFYTEEVEQDYYEVFIEKENIGKIWFTNEKIGLVEGATYDVDLVDINGSILHSIALTATTEYGGVMVWNSEPTFSITDGIVDEELTPGDKTMINVVNQPDVRYVRIHGIPSTQVVYHKIPQEYLDLSEAERLHYYGDSNIFPSDANLFIFTLDDATMTSSIVLTDEAKNDTTLTDIVIPYKYMAGDKEFIVKTIDAYAFDGCTSILSIVIPNGITTIGNASFRECTSLTNIILPDSLTSIAANAFRDCTNLSSIIIPESVTRILPNTFRDCINLSSVTLHDNITLISNTAFYGCSSLSSIVFPKNISSIASGAFSGCEILENITIPSGVKTISSSAFQNCVCLSKITIPSSVTSIRTNAFGGISDLTFICAAGSYAETYAKENGFSIEYTEEVTKTYVDGKIGDDLDERLNVIDERFNTIDERFNTIDEELSDKLDKQVDSTYEGMFLKAINGVATWSPVYIAEEVNF